MFNGRDYHSTAPMKLNDLWPKEDRLDGKLSWEDEAEQVVVVGRRQRKKLRKIRRGLRGYS